jgi:hypothetical protein
MSRPPPVSLIEFVAKVAQNAAGDRADDVRHKDQADLPVGEAVLGEDIGNRVKEEEDCQ